MVAAGSAGRVNEIEVLSADNVAIRAASWCTPPAAAIRHAGGTGRRPAHACSLLRMCGSKRWPTQGGHVELRAKGGRQALQLMQDTA